MLKQIQILEVQSRMYFNGVLRLGYCDFEWNKEIYTLTARNDMHILFSLNVDL